MKEGAPNTSENNIENLEEWQELEKQAPKKAEEFLAERNLSHHEASISTLDGEDGLMELLKIEALVTQMDEKFVKQAEAILKIADPTEREQAQRVYNQSRFVMRHLGYLREVARQRQQQLKLRGIAVNLNEAPVAS